MSQAAINTGYARQAVFEALSDPTRRSIIEILAREGRLVATEIYKKFEVTHSAISQHLKVLREAQLVLLEKRAQNRIYRVNAEKIGELRDWTAQITELWSQRFDALDTVLNEEKGKGERIGKNR